jgi:transposase
MELQLIRQSVGIDIAMNDFKVCYGYMTNKMEQEMIAESTFENTIKGMQGLLLWLSDYILIDEQLYFVMEATGVYHEQLCHYLSDQALNVSVMPSGS